MILSSASDAHGRRAKSNGAVRYQNLLGQAGAGMVAYCNVCLAKEGVIELRPRYL